VRSPSPLPGCSGSWVRSQFCGFACWAWVPSQAQPNSVVFVQEA
jgi:hypothetical protein